MGINPVAQRIMAYGTRHDQDLMIDEINNAAKLFQNKYNGLPLLEREKALKVLIEKVSTGKSDMQLLRSIVRSGQWINELESITKQTRWLKTFPKTIISGVFSK